MRLRTGRFSDGSGWRVLLNRPARQMRRRLPLANWRMACPVHACSVVFCPLAGVDRLAATGRSTIERELAHFQ